MFYSKQSYLFKKISVRPVFKKEAALMPFKNFPYIKHNFFNLTKYVIIY